MIRILKNFCIMITGFIGGYDIFILNAIDDGDVKTIKFLIGIGVNIHKDNDHTLRSASQYGHTEIVKLLLDRGANIHAQNDDALYWASYYGHTEIVELLLDRGANTHAQNDSALYWASHHGHTEIVNLLKEYMGKGKFKKDIQKYVFINFEEFDCEEINCDKEIEALKNILN